MRNRASRRARVHKLKVTEPKFALPPAADSRWRNKRGFERAARLKERYQKEVAPAIAKEFGITNPMAIPRVQKVVLNMGMGEAIANAKILDTAADELRSITGQKPVITKAKKSIASFKLRQGMPIGVMVTLRGDRMYEFLDQLVSICLPPLVDFPGGSPKAFYCR